MFEIRRKDFGFSEFGAELALCPACKFEKFNYQYSSKGEGESDDESCATHDDAATIGESEHTDVDSKSDAGLSEGSLRGTPEPDTILEEPILTEEPEPEPEPPSPAPEELWEYLKEVVTHDAVVSVDELVEKLVTTVSAIPEPYLKSVVKESIKKQKSIEEEEPHPEGVLAENAESRAPPTEGDPSEAPSQEETPVSAEGAPIDTPPVEGTSAEGAPPAEGAEAAPPTEPSPAENAPEAAPVEPAPAEPAPAVEAQPPMVEAAA